jgi:hypothetical protein
MCQISTDMDPDRFRECLDVIGWPLRGLARLLDVNFATVQRWANGAQEIPPHIADWLDTVAKCHEANPPPHRGRAP